MSTSRWFGHPRGLATLFFTEMWERFSFYGMRAILVLAMVSSVESGGLTRDERKRIGAIIVLFFASALFWSGFDQAGSSFNLFTERYPDRVILGWEMPASRLQSVNPFFIVTLAPLFAALWIRLGMRGLEPGTPSRWHWACCRWR